MASVIGKITFDQPRADDDHSTIWHKIPKIGSRYARSASLVPGSGCNAFGVPANDSAGMSAGRLLQRALARHSE